MPAGPRPGRKGAPLSNEESRIRGMAQRALALFMAIVLATTLTPGLALASDQPAADSGNASGQNVAEGSSASDAAPAALTGEDDNADSGNASGANNDSGATGSNGTEANAVSADGDGKSQANTVSATLKISLYGTVLVSHTFSIEKGKTVEDLLDLAKEQGYIDAYTHGEPYTGYTSYYVSSVTIKGAEYAQPVDYSEYWSSTINGSWDTTGINETTIGSDGFSYELNYVSYSKPDTKYDDGTGDYPVDPSTQHPDTAGENDTTSYVKGNGNTSAVTSAPTSSSNAELAWKKTYGSGCYSEVLSIGDSVYLASSLYNADYSKQTAVLHQFNLNGEETASLQLFGAIDSTCRMVYTDGVIIVPLSDGRLQGVSASQMKTMWVSNIIASGAQSLSTVTASGGMVFTGTVNSFDPSYLSATGTFFALNALTGERVWANEETTTGFYWAGACKVGNVLVYGNDAGALTAVDPATGKTVSTLKLSSAIRSTVITNSAGTKAFVVSRDGTLHKVSVAADGTLSEEGSANFAFMSTSTATLFEGNLFVGGLTADGKGSLSVIDAATLQVKQSASLPYEVKSAPLVAKAADGKTYAYFTCNGAEGNWPSYTSGGGAWVYCLETNTAAKLFDATGDLANWCMQSITMGANGTLYWTNDSGTLFALVSSSSSGGDDKGDGDDSKGDGDGSGDQGNEDGSSDQSNGNGKSGNKNGSSSKTGSDKSVAAKTPVTKASAEKAEASEANEPGTGVSASASSTKNASSNTDSNNEESQRIPWLPIVGIVVGCAGLVGVGTYLMRRRNQ